MSDIAYVSKVRIERKVGPLRIAYLRGESQAVTLSVHGAIAKHYKFCSGSAQLISRVNLELCQLPVEWWARLEAR